jgi:hypothetical protein
MQIFDATDYKDYITSRIQEHGRGRGAHGRTAEAAGCKSSYLSQVLHGPAHLTPDQAAGLCEYWSLTDHEAEYFLTLLSLARAGTPALRRRLDRQLTALRERQANLAQRFQRSRGIADADAIMAYYSSWHYAALHMAVGIETFQTTEQLAARFGLSARMTQSALSTLADLGLVQQTESRWQRAPIDLHLPRNSPMAANAHSQWRRRAEARYLEDRDSGLFYTGVHTLAKADIEKLRAIFAEALERSRELIHASPEEELVCVLCDVFRA